jgi:hypothetical protein
MVLLAALFTIFALPLASRAQAAAPEWTFIFYLGVDDDEMAALVDPRLEAMLTGPLPAHVEVLVEHDTFKPDGVFRSIRRGQSLTRETLPEHNSADPARFEDFLRWAKANSRGKRTCLIVNTHAWGWRGIIEDFTVPGKPKYDELMPMDAFAASFAKAKARFDVLWLDTCIMGNAEPIEECKDIAPYLILSQREIADNGFPFEALWEIMEKRPSLKQFLRAVPERYVQLYARNGEMVPEIKYYYVTSAVSVDTRKWDRFAGEFKPFVDLLRENNFLWTVKFRPDLLDAIVEGDDRNVDLVEFLSRVGDWVVDPRVGEQARRLLARIGYPKDVAALSSQSYLLEASKVRSLELRIDADNFLTRPPDKLQSLFIGKWREANQDLPLPSGQSFELVSIPGSKNNDRQFVIRAELKKDLRFRPWFAGTQYFILTTEDHQGRTTRKTYSRDKDYFVADRFPESSYLVAEAHAQGTPFLHGVGMMLYPWMSVYMPKSTNQITGLKGTPYYKSTAWSRRTGWGEATLVNP